MEQMIDVQNDDHLPVMDIDLLTELQDDFKDYTQTRRLADRIMAVGYKYPAFVWQDGGGACYVLDAHSRLRADGATQTVMENERGAAFTRRILADIGEQTYAALKEHFFACPPEIPLNEFKATLRFLRFLTTLTDEERWETSGEQQLDASVYSLD